jgi:predicted AlkP superfamily phosphohydrolase/phosphomutase
VSGPGDPGRAAGERRVFLLGIDGASWNVLDRLVAVGAMPNLARLAREGVRATLESTVPPITPVAWLSLMTGCNPGRHGVYGILKSLPDNSCLPVPVNRADARVPTIFDYFREGGPLVSLNLPMSWPATPINGAMITCMMTPLRNPTAFEHPAGLLARLARVLGEKATSRLQLAAAHVDWARSEAYLDNPFGIRVNLQGRETLGRVPPARFAEVRDRIVRGLDVVFTFRDDLNRAAYDGECGGEVFVPTPHRTGDHRIDGVFVAWGGGVRTPAAPGELRFRIQDVLPTLLHLNGRPVPEICDGRVLSEILADPRESVVDRDWRRFQGEKRAVAYGPEQERNCGNGCAPSATWRTTDDSARATLKPFKGLSKPESARSSGR